MDASIIEAMPRILKLLESKDSEEPLLIYRKKAEEILGIGTTKFYSLMKMADFPRPRIIQGKRPMYLRSDIEKWAHSLSC